MLKVDGLTKNYGQTQVLKEVSFQVENSIHGFLGPNGAGKSTTFKALCGLISYHSGSLSFRGEKINPKRLGYLPERSPLFPKLSVYEYLDYFRSMRKLSSKSVDRAIELASLGEQKHKLCAKLSGGYQRRLGIAQAIIHEPDLLILDEPTLGLDPEALISMRALVQELSEHSMVIFSSHHLEEVEKLCESFTMIHKGRAKDFNSFQELRDVADEKVQGTISYRGEKFSEACQKVKEGEYCLQGLVGLKSISQEVSKMCQAGRHIIEVKKESASLEKLYQEMKELV